VNSHWRTAASAAASSSGIDRRTIALRTLPSAPIVASITTSPCAFALCASGGYAGLTSLIFRGGGMLAPTRVGGGSGGARGGRRRGEAARPDVHLHLHAHRHRRAVDVRSGRFVLERVFADVSGLGPVEDARGEEFDRPVRGHHFDDAGGRTVLPLIGDAPIVDR